ncbi:MAG: HNH endonuclease signature motif containing protein [Solirubrobacteraceae bacterium]|nr:HNH endonuclease signature motif containing protein [Solirubrobacteraceae bacterium]
MLREVKSAQFAAQGMWFWKRYVFEAGRQRAAVGLTASQYASHETAQRTQAIRVMCDGRRQYWWCRDRFYWDDDGLEPDDVYALAYERERRRQRQLERAHAVLSTDGLARRARREPVPREVKLAVFERDAGCCVECGSSFEIQYDHVIPLALGGASTVENLQILCAPCNQRKGAAL